MVFQYLLVQFGRRLTDFMRRWYIEATIRIWAALFDQLQQIDRIFAIRINAKLWLEPLYGDYTPVGRIIGPIFRTFRILLGLSMYGILTALTFIIWVIWLLVPAYIASRILM